MLRRILTLLLSAACVGLLSVSAFAADTPVLSGESSAMAGASLYNYKPFAAGTGARAKDVAYCAVTERVRDDNGNCYIVQDSAPLSNTSLFRRKINVEIGADVVDKIALADADDAKNEFAGTSYAITLESDYYGQHAVIAFETVYTAKEDAVLTVAPLLGGETQELAVQKGAQITCISRVTLSEDAVLATSYPDAVKPYVINR